MKKWIFAAVLCGSVGCAIQEPGQPMQFAPGAPAESESNEEAAPRREALEADDSDEAAVEGDAVAPSGKASEEKQAKPMPNPSAAPAPARSRRIDDDAAAICDSACKTACKNAADQNLCAQAYAAGCFSGTAPATFDCGASGVKGKAKPDGVEERGTPVVIP